MVEGDVVQVRDLQRLEDALGRHARLVEVANGGVAALDQRLLDRRA